MPERLQKIIAHAGFASRREAEEMIRTGRVTVNGRVVTELGTKADGERDHIKVDGKLITRAEPHRYILLYKPKEVMTTVDDPEGRTTVIDLIRGVRERIYPVGRLDYHSEGLVLLTNDGELAYKIAHPRHGSVKTYNVKVRGVPDDRVIDNKTCRDRQRHEGQVVEAVAEQIHHSKRAHERQRYCDARDDRRRYIP